MFEIILYIYTIIGCITAIAYLFWQYQRHEQLDKDDIKMFLFFSAAGFVGPIIWGIILFVLWWSENDPITVVADCLTKLFDSVLKTKDATHKE